MLSGWILHSLANGVLAEHVDPLLVLRVIRIVRALVVVRLSCFYRSRRIVEILGIVQRRIFGEVIEIVRRRRLERGSRCAVHSLLLR